MLKTYIETDVNRRREYVKTFATVERAMSQLPHILPEYMLVFAIPVLTHDPQFTDFTDPAQLRAAEKCLWLILDPLINNKEFFCCGFYRNIIERMKNHKDAFKPDDEPTNMKMWALCDIAAHLVSFKTPTYGTREFPPDARIPSMYFQSQPEDFQNTKIYIPTDMYESQNQKKTIPIAAERKRGSRKIPESSLDATDAQTTSVSMDNIEGIDVDDNMARR